MTDAQTPSAGVTTYAYDSENNLTSITDALGRATSFTYDSYGRVTKATFPSTLEETYTYDAMGNLLSKTDRKGQVINYFYDALNRLSSKSYPDSTSVTYTYDAGSRLTQVADPTGTYQFAYDNMGRLTGTTTDYSFLTSRTFTNAYQYDAASNRTRFTDPESGQTDYVYDALNRLTSLTNFSAQTFTFSYDALGRRTQLTRPNGVNTDYSYDNLSRLLSVLHKLGATTIDGATYTVDAVGNRTSKLNHINSITESYTYDAIYQLTQVVQNGTTTTEAYSYDKVGNRLSTVSDSGWAYNNSNQLTSRPGVTYTYDNNGNTLTKTDASGTTQYAWDFENRLSSVTLPGGSVVTFKYDPMGRRIQKASASSTINYVYDRADEVEEVDGTGAVLVRYAMRPGIDQPLSMLRSGATSYYETDGLGSVTSLTDGAGSAVGSYVYESFGKQTSPEGGMTNSFRYTAREFDAESRLYFYRARFYDQGAGRFLGEDPLRFGAGNNFYRYVANQPIRFADPSGLHPGQCAPPCAAQDFSFQQGSGNYTAGELEAMVQTAVGEASTRYFSGEVEAVIATMVNRQNYNIAYVSDLTGRTRSGPFLGGTTITEILRVGYDAFRFRSGDAKLRGAKGRDGILRADSYVCRQLLRARQFAELAGTSTPEWLITNYPFTFFLGSGGRVPANAYNRTRIGDTTFYMTAFAW